MALIEIRKLTKLYRMGDDIVRALDGVDLDIERGEFVAITGPSGSGKSTMMHLLGCLDRPTAGTYVFNGSNVSEMSDRELAAIRNREIGFVFQTFNLINRTTALDNVGVPLFYARKVNTRGPARRALERVGLSRRMQHRPSELSGGERQRVAIARAIVSDPLLLLADEPTGNLDTRTGEQIMEIFRRLNEQGVSIVLVTHEADVAAQARRIVQMRDGRIVADLPNRAVSGTTAAYTTARKPLEYAGAADGAVTAQAGAGEHLPPGDAESPRDLAAAMAALPARMARGANRALWCGLTALLLLGAALGAGRVARAAGFNAEEFDFAKLPASQKIAVLTSSLGLPLSIILSIVAVVWGGGVLKRIAREPGNWLGRGRARLGRALGWTGVLIPVLTIAYQLFRGR